MAQTHFFIFLKGRYAGEDSRAERAAKKTTARPGSHSVPERADAGRLIPPH